MVAPFFSRTKQGKKMRLLTHNLLCCLKCQSYPLDIQADVVAPAEAAFDATFVRRMLARITYSYLVDAFNALREQHQSISMTAAIPATVEEVTDLTDESAQLKAIHFAMNGVAVKNGKLKCAHCSMEYLIDDYIPNMVLE
jgi:multifunctional methyltransferase subunit TRM112